ncbi:D(1) dopamine receptor-like [Patiria miniata]|uniref:G-protein coupled receptors family 1 profile domain-containing protein n=1 Tax=Patiria miniata TaxID=46514 RepID=A0A913Z6W9_PATMI|nr:D(1) dopamine receptor-like [Patiria miniata]
MDMNDTAPAGEGGRTVAENVLMGITLYAITVCSIVGNILVIVAVLTVRRLRSSITNYFIVSLACADLMVSMLVMPFAAVFEITDSWPFGLAFCDAFQAFDILSATASILNLCVISLDRFMAITSPFTYYSRMNSRTAFALIATAWIVSFLISVLPVTLDLHEDEDLKAIGWYSDPYFCVLSMNSTYALISSLISFYIPAAIILFTYARIYVVARRQARQIAAYDTTANRVKNGGRTNQKTMARERKAAKTLAIIVGVFILCWLPFFVVNIIDPYCGHCLPPLPVKIFVWLGYINSFLNPLIYAQNKTFKSAFKSVLCCYQCRGINPRDVDTSDEERTAVSRAAPRVQPSPKPEPKTTGSAQGNTSKVYVVPNGALTAHETASVSGKTLNGPHTPTDNKTSEDPNSTELQNLEEKTTDINDNDTQT